MSLSPEKFRHLSRDDHIIAATLTRQAQETLDALAKLVNRAPYTDRTLRVQRDVQEKLIDPLREAWDESEQNPYQSIGYWP